MRILKSAAYVITVCLALLAVMQAFSGTVAAQKDDLQLSLRLLPGDFGNVAPGKPSTFLLEVRNSGNTILTSIILTSQPPQGWLVGFKPESISSMSPGGSLVVDVTVTPARTADRGSYNITLLAEGTNPDTGNKARNAASIYVQVQGGVSFWVWVGIGLAALVIAVFIFIFIRSSK